MKLMLVEGTPQEMSEMQKLGFFDFEKAVTSKQFSDEPATKSELTEDVLINGFTRSGGMTPTQRRVIKAIYEGDAKGVRSSKIAEVTGFPSDEVKAAMRTIGKRFKNTEGWPDGMKTFDQTWTGLENIYRLHPEMRAVINKGNVVL